MAWKRPYGVVRTDDDLHAYENRRAALPVFSQDFLMLFPKVSDASEVLGHDEQKADLLPSTEL